MEDALLIDSLNFMEMYLNGEGPEPASETEDQVFEVCGLIINHLEEKGWYKTIAGHWCK